MFKLLDKYIIKELTNVFFFGVIAFSSIFAGVGVIPNLVSEANNYGLDLITVINLFIARIPQVMVYTFPMSILLATLQVFGRLSTDSEISAFRAGGISLIRIIFPALIVGFMVSMLTMVFNELLVPKSTLYVNYLIAKAKNEYKPVFRSAVNIPQYEDGYLKRTINAKEMYKQTMKDITVIEYEKGNLQRVVFANQAIFNTGKGWLFFNGILYLFDKEEDSISRVTFDKEYINLKLSPTDINVILEQSYSQQLGFFDLSKHILIKQKTGEDVSKLLVELYLKTSLPFACLIFTLLGAPLGLNPQRSSNSVGIGLSLLVVVVYYILMAVGEWLGLIHILTPFIAAWIPNLTIGAMGMILLLKRAHQ
ncbi:MAG: LptF/LptG family permease [Candidatus Margulisbacteria bacterium]|nr:LptF/LptG family permease [Candidatus Margulisiibacteriota bacterium]